jgi:hypothetical protein
MSNAARPQPHQPTQAPTPPDTRKAASADQRIAQAVARMDATRSTLIQCLAPEPPEPRHQDDGRTGDPGRSFAESLAARLQRNGLVQGSWRTLRAVTRRWWGRQPWHHTVELLGQTLVHQARPLVRRHPLATLAVGAALGAGLVAAVSAARPWAWQQARRQIDPLRDRIGSLLWTQLTSAPVQIALAGALAAWLAEQGSRRSAQPQTPTNDSHPEAATRASAAGADAPRAMQGGPTAGDNQTGTRGSTSTFGEFERNGSVR